MKKLLLLLCCAVCAAAFADITVFPGSKINSMAGFQTWQCGADAITAVQSRGYSWSAIVPAELDAAKVSAFNMVLSSDQDIDGKLTIYFRRKGEKTFDKASFCRKNFTAKANEPLTVSIPMKNANWQGDITGFRFDISGKTGAKWTISKIYFTAEEDTAASAEIGIFPEIMLYPMAGFEKWQCGKDAITAVQTRQYSWSAIVPVELQAAKVTAFNMVLSAGEDINGKLTIYFRRKGEKTFDKASFCRKNFTAKANAPVLVTIPMKNANWKDSITGFRFDISGKQGLAWKITRIYFTGSSDAALSVGAKAKTAVKAKKPSTPAQNLSSDIVLFPGKKKLESQVGFKTFKCGETEIAAEQSKDYSYTAIIPVNITKPENYKFFNCLVQVPNNLSGNLSIYFARKGDKAFRDVNRKRAAFNIAANKEQLISIPLSGGNWKGVIDRVRIDISGKMGQKWSIRKMWFSKTEAGMFKNKAFNAAIKLDGTPATLVEKRYDLLEGREYRFAMQCSGVETASVTVDCFDDVDKKLGTFTAAPKDGSCALEFSIPTGTTYTNITVSADGKNGSLDNFRFGETGKRSGANWQAAWICHPQARRTADPAVFTYTREFELPTLPQDGRVQLTADDGYILVVNGKEIARRVGGWQQTALHGITSSLKPGKNKVEISVMNENGPTAMIAELRFDMADGKTILIPTDKEFSVRQTEGKGALAGSAPAMVLGIPPIPPWHSVAYNTLYVRKKLDIVSNALTFKNGKITGKLNLKDFALEQLPLLIKFDGGIAGKYNFPVKNQIAQINIDTAASNLLPGDYELIADPALISSQVTLIKFNVPPQKAEANSVVKMVLKDGYLQAEYNGKPLWFSGFRARRASQRERAYRDGDYRIILYGV